MNIADLKRSKADLKAEKNKAMKEPVGGEDGFDHTMPTIALHEHHLEKMGIDEMPGVGQHMEMHGSGKVTHSSEEKSADGKKNRRLHIQVHRLGLSKRRGENDGDIRSDLKKAAKGEVDGKGHGGKDVY